MRSGTQPMHMQVWSAHRLAVRLSVVLPKVCRSAYAECGVCVQAEE